MSTAMGEGRRSGKKNAYRLHFDRQMLPHPDSNCARSRSPLFDAAIDAVRSSMSRKWTFAPRSNSSLAISNATVSLMRYVMEPRGPAPLRSHWHHGQATTARRQDVQKVMQNVTGFSQSCPGNLRLNCT